MVFPCSCFFFNDTATTEIYTLSLHDALPISRARFCRGALGRLGVGALARRRLARAGSVRHVRRHVPRPPRSAPHPDVGDLRRRLSPPEELPAPRPFLAGGAGPPGAERESRSALFARRAVDRRRRRRLTG